MDSFDDAPFASSSRLLALPGPSSTGSPIFSTITSNMGSVEETPAIPGSRLLALPAEIRDEIWQFAYSNEGTINLLTAKGPSTALLCTCRQLRAEGHRYFEEASSQYWKTGDFVLKVRMRTHERVLSDVRKLRDVDLKQITKMRIYGLRETYFFQNGIWTCSGQCSHPRYIYKHCPRRAIRERWPETPVEYRYSTWTIHDGIPEEGHDFFAVRFANLRDGVDVDEVKEVIAWEGLTVTELKAMVVWYWRVMAD